VPRAVRILAVVPLLLVLAAPAAARSRRDFPRGFLWGTAIAGFQTEMGGPHPHADPHSDWWAWSHDRANVDAGRVSGDLPERGPGHWSVYRRDLDLARLRLHTGAFRLSVEWSRIFPRSTRSVRIGRRLDRGDLRRLDRLASKPALRHYLRELAAIRRRHMKAFVTVSHFSLPSWIQDPIAVRDAFARVGPGDPPPTGIGARGWLDAGTVTEFRKYAAYLAWKLRGRVALWAPINEPLVVVASGYFNVPGVFAGFFPPGVFSFTGAREALLNLERANTAAYDAIKRFDPHSRVGLVENMIAFTPSDPGSARDRKATRDADRLYNRLFIDAAVRGDIDSNADGRIEPGERHRHGRKADFVGVNYYFRGRIAGTGAPLTPTIPLLDFVPTTTYRWPLAPTAPPCPTTCSEFGSEIHPQGFRTVLREAGGYHLPVYVTENGIADADDDQRPAYLRSHLRVLRDAMRDHLARVRGYFEWSLVDNFEWASGYAPRFGLYSFDPRTLQRRARPSAGLYGRIARTGRIGPGPGP
jgi:beta-galactosidase